MSLRMEKVASLIKEEMGLLFTREYNNPEYGFITVTEVHMTPDLRIAKIYVSVLGNKDIRKKTMHFLDNEVPHIRQRLGSILRLKFTPSVQFYLDETFDKVERIEMLIKQIHEHDQDQKHEE